MEAPESITASYGLQSADCPFLSLPGELRNRIYDYCIEPGWITLQPAHRKHRHKPSRMDYGGLRYGCRIMYTEFTPVYLARTVVSLQPSDVERHLSTFYPRLPTVNNQTSPLNHLHSNIHGRILLSLRLGEVLDLTPLAGLLLRAPKVRIDIARGLAINPMMRDGVDLLRTITDSSCSVDFQHTVERILFRYSLRAEVVIKLQREITFDELFGKSEDRNSRQWFVQQGFPILGRLRIVIESSQGTLRDPLNAEDAAA